MDVSYLLPAIGGVFGGIFAEWLGQNRVEQQLDGGAAVRWRQMGGLPRYAVRRDLRRGRLLVRVRRALAARRHGQIGRAHV